VSIPIVPTPAASKDEASIKQLLGRCGLPFEDIRPLHLRHFFIVRDQGNIVGVVGMEILGPVALLRSLAVDPRFRGQGIASELIKKAEEYAASLGIEALYLLTMTAEGFFAQRGYERLERSSAPPQVQGTTEFKALCPASSACMFKYLRAV